MADGTIAGGMIPKVESCVARRAQRRAAAPTSSTAASPTCCCSRSSPTPASAPWSSTERVRRPDRSTEVRVTAHAFATADGDHCPFMPVFGAAAGDVRARAGHRAVGRPTGKRYLDFLCGLAVDVARPLQPGVAEAIAEQADTLLHVSQLLRQPGGHRGGGRRSTSCCRGDRAAAARCSSATPAPRPTSARFKLARKFGGRGRHVVVSALGSFHGRTLAALAATGQPAKHEPFQPMPEGFRHVACGDLDALAAADRPERSPPC